MKVSIILVNYNGLDVLPECLHSLKQFIPQQEHEIIIVDNASSDGSQEYIKSYFPEYILVQLPENRGFGSGNNAGARIARGEFLFFLNTDTVLTSNILPHLIELMITDQKIGIIGTKLLNPDGSFQISFASKISFLGEFKTMKMYKAAKKSQQLKLISEKYQQITEVDIVVGASFFMRANLFNQLGGFDEKFFMYFEESDLCQRTQNQGYKVIYTPQASLIHIRGHSVKKNANPMAVEYRRSQIYFYDKHRPLWEIYMLRLYLISKFFWEWLKTGNKYSLQIIYLAITYRTQK